jgi:hypothetical protein
MISELARVDLIGNAHLDLFPDPCETGATDQAAPVDFRSNS